MGGGEKETEREKKEREREMTRNRESGNKQRAQMEGASGTSCVLKLPSLASLRKCSGQWSVYARHMMRENGVLQLPSSEHFWGEWSGGTHALLSGARCSAIAVPRPFDTHGCGTGSADEHALSCRVRLDLLQEEYT